MSVTITTLPSGLRVMTDDMPHLKTTSLGIWVGIGSRHETEAEHGLSHFLEHMAFKGTRRRSARRIAEEIEGAGGELNAATSTEQTAYYARVLAADTGLALDILADILTESTFDPAEVEREKEVVLEEIGAVEDVPGRSRLRTLHRDRLSGPADRPADPRHAPGRLVLQPRGRRRLPGPSLQRRHDHRRGRGRGRSRSARRGSRARVSPA